MDNQNQFNSAPGQGGKFCFFCGTPLDQNGLCPNCDKQPDPEPESEPDVPEQSEQTFDYGQPVPSSASQQPQPQPQEYNYSQPRARRKSYRKASAGANIFNYALDYIRMFFSPDPTDVLDKAVKEKQPVWGVLGPGAVFLVTLGIFGVMINCISVILTFIPGVSYINYALGGNSELTVIKIKLFIYTLVVITAFFFSSAAFDTVFFSLQKKKADYVQNMNVLSAAMLPLATCGAAAFVVSFIYIPLSLVLLMAGVIFKYLMLYDGLKKIGRFDKNPTWDVFGLVSVSIAAFGLLFYVFGNIIF